MDVDDSHENARDALGHAAGAAPAVAAVRFRIGGWLRFLSHAETLRVFERACARAAIPVRYTQGFNPHPKLSLPLPRAVGVESDEELLVLRLSDERAEDADPTQRLSTETRIKEALGGALPAGIELMDVRLVERGVSFRPRSARYVFTFGPDRKAQLAEPLKERAATVLASERLVVERRSPEDRRGRPIDVRPFLLSIQLRHDRVEVMCGISGAGSVRVEEIMKLLGLETEDLSSPIRRSAVEWEAA